MQRNLKTGSQRERKTGRPVLFCSQPSEAIMVSLLITPTLHGVALRRDVRRRCGMRERPVLQLDSRAPLTLEDVRDAYEVCSLIPEPGERGQCYSVFGLDSSRMASYYETVLDLEDRLAAGDGQHQHRSCDGASTSSPASSLAVAAPGQQDHAAADTSATSVAAAASEAPSRQHASSAALLPPHALPQLALPFVPTAGGAVDGSAPPPPAAAALFVALLLWAARAHWGLA